ncbi:restriction endonuclease subunit S [Streptococcus suis]|uniref:restriction endonuclease subunit S n=5 Tax=Streptococcus suis TaxID=1307 RepID=UPI00076959E7|nr:restriction endonuclease subunit S [Streptococcus suis]MBS0759943.1 restriction endonuclease subunit S [Streptococcus suis]MBS8051378.1 restriction endonuclease subunit S [Streptococcus suis]MBS8060612.1 restriction endonuclease subunit S [Streptococcus suis]MBS8072489.1 restriction endonuclease subunit S [Streptococcus suis]MCB2882168.1 restriction endonuclease subunit S [Streptococcus suis]
MTKEKSTVPRLRFPGFTDAWKQRKAMEIFKFVSDKGYADLPILSASQELGMIRRDEIGIDIKYDKEAVANYKRVLPGQFVIHLRSFQGGFAWSEIEGLTSPAYTILDFKEENSSKFWRNVLTSPNFIKKLETVTYGIRDGRSISYSDFSTLNFVIPTLPEQEAIGSFFSDLDQLITLHQRKLDDVKELKKALLQKMFPKGNGNDFPELRFPEFTDAWKQRKLGEVADFSIKTNSLSRDKLSSYFYEVQNIHYGDILTKYDAILDVCNKELPSIIGSTISDFADALLSEGDIVFADAAEDSTVGKAIEVRNFKGKNVVSGLHTIVARPKVSYAPYYLGYLINSTAYHNQILPLMQGTKVSSISKANLKSTTVVFPTLPEQEAIGSFFSDLDQLITLHQRQLDHLKLLKKALLQQMFI